MSLPRLCPHRSPRTRQRHPPVHRWNRLNPRPCPVLCEESSETGVSTEAVAQCWLAEPRRQRDWHPLVLLVPQFAIATMISQGPEAYKRITDALMTFGGPINRGSLDRIARGANIDLDASLSSLDDPEVDRRIAETHALGRNMQITGTPTFIVGEKLVRGYLPLEEMRRVVALSRSVN